MVKFSHDRYAKLVSNPEPGKDGDAIILVGIQECYLSQLPDLFKEWDTRYYDDGIFHYPLAGAGKYLILFYFDIPRERLFCTIRKHTHEKASYYKSKLFQQTVLKIK